MEVGTHTTHVTGQTMSRNGGPQATATTSASIPGPEGWTAYVANSGSDTVTPIDLETNTAGPAIPVGDEPVAIAITPDGKTAYVANASGDSVTPINTATNTAGPAIPTGADTEPYVIAITPDGTTAWTANIGMRTVTPIDLATKTVGAAIPISNPFFFNSAGSVTISPDGATLYVAGSPLDPYNRWVVPINLATRTAGESIENIGSASGTAITPDGSTAYVGTADGVLPVDIATGIVGTKILAGTAHSSVAVTPDGATVIVTNIFDQSVTLVATATNTAGPTISVGANPFAVAATPDQAPVARLHVDRAPLGQPSTLDASASTVAFGTRASYFWDFGDGTTATTTTPVTQHTYTEASLTASVTVTSSGGTGATQTFTGQTMSNNGDPSATAVGTRFASR